MKKVLIKQEKLSNGLLRLTAPNGVVDIRNYRVYSEVETTPEYLKYFRANSIT